MSAVVDRLNVGGVVIWYITTLAAIPTLPPCAGSFYVNGDERRQRRSLSVVTAGLNFKFADPGLRIVQCGIKRSVCVFESGVPWSAGVKAVPAAGRPPTPIPVNVPLKRVTVSKPLTDASSRPPSSPASAPAHAANRARPPPPPPAAPSAEGPPPLLPPPPPPRPPPPPSRRRRPPARWAAAAAAAEGVENLAAEFDAAAVGAEAALKGGAAAAPPELREERRVGGRGAEPLGAPSTPPAPPPRLRRRGV